MTAVGPLLFVLLFAALGTAGFTGVGVRDSRDTRYTLVCTPPAPPSQRRPQVSERPPSQQSGRRGWFALPAFLTHRRQAR